MEEDFFSLVFRLIKRVLYSNNLIYNNNFLPKAEKAD